MTIYVINPNSSAIVTKRIADAIAPVTSEHVSVRCVTLHNGPPGIESDAEVADAGRRVVRHVAGLKDAQGVVVACFSDPGVGKLKEKSAVPVVGIREAAVEAALKFDGKFGVIAIGAASVPRHLAAFQNMGVMDRLAGDRPLGLSVSDLEHPQKVLKKMIHIAQELKDKDRADVLVLGCAGMPFYRDNIETEVGLPVVEPCAAAVARIVTRS